MGRRIRASGYVLIGLLAALALIAVLLFVFTRTEWGVERVGRFAIDRISRGIQGELRVRRVTSRGLLGTVTAQDVAIDDPQGRPFVRADSAILRYNWRTLAGGRIVLTRVDLFDPEVYLEKLPGDTAWNFEYIFEDTTPEPEEPRLVLLENVRVRNGLVVVQVPWEPPPGEPIEPEDTSRLILRREVGGLQREFRFEAVNGRFPQVLWESPEEEGQLFRVRSLSTRGYIWDAPFHLRDFRGTITVRDSIIAFKADRVRFPSSRSSVVGRVIVGRERPRYDIKIEGHEVAFSDLQWLYPPLPEEGGGSLDFRMQTQEPKGTLWLAQNMRIRAPGTQVTGTFGIVTGDTLYFTQVDLRASPLNIQLIEDMLPGELPVEGLLVGTVEVEGPVSSLSTRGDLRLAQTGSSRSSSAVRWSGTVDLRGSMGVQNFEANVRGLDLALLSALRPDLRLRGSVSGRVRATGRLDRSLRFSAALRHQLAGAPASALEGRGAVRFASGRSAVDVKFEAQPVSLDALAGAFPGLARLRGEARGPIAVTGSLDDLAVAADLATPAGRFQLEGRLDLARATPRYRAVGRIGELRLDRMLDGLPESLAAARFTVEGEGTDLAGARGGLRLELDTARIGPFLLHAGLARISFEDGVARVDSLFLATDAGRLEARGTLGLVAGRQGTLRATLQADSLAALRPFFFPDAPTGLDADTSRTRLGGTARLEAELRGSLAELAAEGEARLQELAYGAAEVGRAELRFTAAAIRTDSLRLRVEGAAEALDVFNRQLTTARASVEYAAAGGRLELEAGAAEPEESEYRLVSGFRRVGGGVEFDLREVYARTGTEAWGLAEPAQIRVGSGGIRVSDLLLARADGVGRVRAAGQLPWLRDPASPEAGDFPASLRVDFEQLPLIALRRREAPESPVLATLTGHVNVTGTARTPVVNSELTFTELRFGELRLDRFDARLSYADRRFHARVAAQEEGREVLAGEGRVPLDLTLAPVAERRLDQPLEGTLRADGLPVVLFTSFLKGFHGVEGTVDGTVFVTGTTREPGLGGELALHGGAVTWEPSGVRYRNVEGTFRMVGERTVAVDASGRAGDGRATAAGTLTFQPLNDPIFDLVLKAREFEGARRRDAEVTGTGELRLTGRYTRPEVRGAIRVDKGALYLDEVWRRYQIVALDDPLLFDVVDTSVVSVRKLLPASSNPFLKGLFVNVNLDVGRDTWLRGRNLNVEVAGALTVEYDRTAEDLRLTGTLNAIRGYYELFFAEAMPVRRFAVREGTVDFDGTPGINPRLEITATYRARQESGPLNVQAVMTGTLQNPRVALRSDAEPPISESDLLSYLIFGRPTYQLVGGERGQLNTAVTRLGFDVATPTLLGWAAAGLESFASNLNLGVDHLAITEWEGSTATDPATGPLGLTLAQRLQVEVGSYLFTESLYAAVTRRLMAEAGETPGLGGRFEWRFAPTWTAEFFFEDRFARTPSFGLSQTLDPRKVKGFFLFREWAY